MPKTIASEIIIHCANEAVVLRGDGTVFLPKFNTLLVADLHLGKSASLRAAGIPVPEGVDNATLRLLTTAVESSNAANVFLLGDLIHNRDSITPALVTDFSDWRNSHSELQVTLVRGNHDRFLKSFPEAWGLDEVMLSKVGPFQLVHETPILSTPIANAVEPGVNVFRVGGHWHPVVVVGRGADRMRLPCFVVGKSHLTLPAFGPFKGGMKQERQTSNSHYVICDGMVWHA